MQPSPADAMPEAIQFGEFKTLVALDSKSLESTRGSIFNILPTVVKYF